MIVVFERLYYMDSFHICPSQTKAGAAIVTFVTFALILRFCVFDFMILYVIPDIFLETNRTMFCWFY